MKRKTVLIVLFGLAAAFGIGVVVGSSAIKVKILNEGIEAAVIEMSTIPPAVAEHLVSRDLDVRE